MEDQEKDTCYVCLSSKGTLVIPCIRCNGLVHKKCIQEQLDRGNYICGACKQRFDTENKKIVNYHQCMGSCGQGFLMFILMIINWFGMPLLYFGSSLVDFDSLALASLLLLLPVMVTISTSQFPCCWKWYWDDPCWRWHDIWFNKRDCCCIGYGEQGWSKKKYTIQSVFLIVFEIVLVVVSHLIGNPILDWLYDIDESFTWRTSLAGLIICYIVFGILMIIYFCCYCPCKCVLARYSEDKVVIKNLDKRKNNQTLNV